MSAAENADLHSHHADLIAEALVTEGGHLSIGRGGFILWYGDGCRLLGYDSEPIKAACIEAGLPVIDSRGVTFDTVARLVIRGPMVAVGAPPDPPPHGPFSYAPLRPLTNSPTCMTGVPIGAWSLHGHWMLPSLSSFS